MVILRRIVNLLLFALFLNIPLLVWILPWTFWVNILLVLVLVVFFILFLIDPRGGRFPTPKTGKLARGYELLLIGAISFVMEIGLYIRLVWFSRQSIPLPLLIGGGIWALAMLYLALFIGTIRVSSASTQISVTLRSILVFLWWVPALNLVLAFMASCVAGHEVNFALQKHNRNLARQAKQICRTRYPLLLVHGIFFRDWKHLNYWGRIPDELFANGATVFYGQQESSASVEQSAAELQTRIMEIVQQTGCEKVNIIAHSKGGLDSRYAISQLGMDGCVASLTTINTPHHGCRFAGKALDLTPDKLVGAVGRGYDKLFRKLGDQAPDFFTGVADLTDETCATLNKLMPDKPGVLYQSVGTKMHSAKSAGFPLNLGYNIIQSVGDGDNDGLVNTRSMAWTGFLGILEAPGKNGISHADIIDLTRKDIRGFDVCEYYVGLVANLKTLGL